MFNVSCVFEEIFMTNEHAAACWGVARLTYSVNKRDKYGADHAAKHLGD